MKKIIEERRAEEQAGFGTGRGTIDHISLRLIAEKYLEL